MADYRAIARAAAVRHGIDPILFERQIDEESGFNPKAVSPAGARGIAQIMPEFHPGVDTDNPDESLDYAAKLMKWLMDRYGDVQKALAGYNAGPTAVDRYGGVPPFPETQRYVRDILGSPKGGKPMGPGTPSSPIADLEQRLAELDQKRQELQQQRDSLDEVDLMRGKHKPIDAALRQLDIEYNRLFQQKVTLEARESNKKPGPTPTEGLDTIYDDQGNAIAKRDPATGKWNNLPKVATAAQQGMQEQHGDYYTAAAEEARQRAELIKLQAQAERQKLAPLIAALQNKDALVKQLQDQYAAGQITLPEMNTYVDLATQQVMAVAEGVTPYQKQQQALASKREEMTIGKDIIGQRLSAGQNLTNSLIQGSNALVSKIIPNAGEAPTTFDPFTAAMTMVNAYGGGQQVGDLGRNLLLGATGQQPQEATPSSTEATPQYLPYETMNAVLMQHGLPPNPNAPMPGGVQNAA